MAIEQFTNNGADTLNGAINNSVTSLVVHSASTFPTSPYFHILIDSEILKVTAVSGTTFTISRAQEGTTAASHADAAAVTEVLTAASLQNAVVQNSKPNTTHVSADFTAVNSASATDEDGAIRLTLLASNQTSFNWRLLAYTTGIVGTTIAEFQAMGMGASGAYLYCGFGFRDSAANKMTLLQLGFFSGSPPELDMFQWTSLTANSSRTNKKSLSVITTGLLINLPSLWVKIVNDGTNLTFYTSLEGTNWVQVYTETLASFLSGTIDQIVWGAGYWANGSTDPDLVARLRHFSQ